jgi:hypothetical protein
MESKLHENLYLQVKSWISMPLRVDLTFRMLWRVGLFWRIVLVSSVVSFSIQSPFMEIILTID